MFETSEGHEGWVRARATEMFRAQGVTVETLETPDGLALLDAETGTVLPLENVTAVSAKMAKEGSEAAIAWWVDQYLRFLSGAEPTEAELQTSLRTRLLPQADAPEYAPVVAEGICLILARDTQLAAENLSDGTVAALPFSVEDAFAIGQRNTDAEPLNEVFELDDGIWVLGSNSFYVAAKVASFENLMKTIGQAPCGVFFCPVAADSIVYSIVPAGPEAMNLLGRTADLTNHLAEWDRFESVGGPITDSVYFWAPDGRVERVATSLRLPDGKNEITVTPGPVFDAWVDCDL